MSASQNRILMNVRMGSFPVLGSSCEESHLSKDGDVVLGPKAVLLPSGLI